MPTVVDTLYEDHLALSQLLASAAEPSLQVAANDSYRKSLVLAAASFFEHAIMEALSEFISTTGRGDARLISLCKKKAIDQKYFTYFEFKDRNCNGFFAIFGPAFRAAMVAAVDADPKLDEGAQAFLDLGRLRNELVHRNFAAFPLDKTAEEIYQLYQRALVFVDRIRLEFGCSPVAQAALEPKVNEARLP